MKQLHSKQWDRELSVNNLAARGLLSSKLLQPDGNLRLTKATGRRSPASAPSTSSETSRARARRAQERADHQEAGHSRGQEGGGHEGDETAEWHVPEACRKGNTFADRSDNLAAR